MPPRSIVGLNHPSRETWSMMSHLHEVRSEKPLSASRPVLLCFYDDHDARSRHMRPILSEVASVFGEHLDVMTFEVGDCRNLARIDKVRIDRIRDALPHFVLVVDGVQRGRLTGLRRRREIVALLSRHVGPDIRNGAVSGDAPRPPPGPVSRDAA